jgi:hypothetical protein
MAEAGAFIVWLGAAAIVLADGRRGLALGLGLIGLGLAAISWGGADWISGSFLLVGGAAAAVLRLRSGRPGWGFMPAGSTPRLILALVGGLLALWVGASVATGAGAPLRFAAIALLGMLTARALQAPDASIALAATAGLALAIGAASGLAPDVPIVAITLLAAVIAAGASLIPHASPRGD